MKDKLFVEQIKNLPLDSQREFSCWCADQAKSLVKTDIIYDWQSAQSLDPIQRNIIHSVLWSTKEDLAPLASMNAARTAIYFLEGQKGLDEFDNKILEKVNNF